MCKWTIRISKDILTFSLAAYCDDIVGICAVEVWNANASWKRLLALECLVETLAKLWLDAQSLEYEYAHTHKTLLGGIIALVNGII